MAKKIWHDLIENPKDLPEKSEFIKIQEGPSYFDCYERVIEWTDYLCERDKRR